MSFGISKNIFGVKTVLGKPSRSLTGTTEAAIANLAGLAQFGSLTTFLPDEIRLLVNNAHANFITPFDNRRFNRIGTDEERLEIVNGLTVYKDSLTDQNNSNDPVLITFIECIIRGTNAAYNMKHLESTFISYKEETNIEISKLKDEINLLLNNLFVRTGDAEGYGNSNFTMEMTDYYTIYIYIYGYHPDDPTWVTEERVSIVTDVVNRVHTGEIQYTDILPELYINT